MALSNAVLPAVSMHLQIDHTPPRSLPSGSAANRTFTRCILRSTLYGDRIIPVQENQAISAQGKRTSQEKRAVSAAGKGFGASSLTQSKKDTSIPIKTKTGIEKLNVDTVLTREPNCRVKFEFTIPAETCASLWEDVVHRFRVELETKSPWPKNAKPQSDSTVAKMVGEKEVRRMVCDVIMDEHRVELFGEVGDSMISESLKVDMKADDFNKDAPFKFGALVDVYPKLKWKNDDPTAYRNLEVVVPLDVAPPEEEAERELEALRKEHASLAVSTEGLKLGDVAIMDITCIRVNDDGSLGEAIESCCQRGFQVDTATDRDLLLKGLAEGMVGMKTGDTRTLDLTFPKNWNMEELIGLTGRFTLHCQEVFARVLPPLDDALAQKLTKKASTIDEVRALLMKKHEDTVNSMKATEAEQAILKGIAELVDVGVPEHMIATDGRRQFAEYLLRMQEAGKAAPAVLKKMTTERFLNQFIEDNRSWLEMRFKQSLALDEIYRLEPETHVPDEKIEAEYAELMKSFDGGSIKVEDEERAKEEAFDLLRSRYVLAWLKDRATVKFVTRAAAPAAAPALA
eukprot:TRINITY_DN16983_c0_g1_i1.p1 TRINITY_DN16983_c0_g1~~TRINITY_DN16983_c0_g1_i1.p1  ORF type:complete len:570 (+),score=120.57 TRINITY_DN16983_c0_g1_i1:144-1853(+)